MAYSLLGYFFTLAVIIMVIMGTHVRSFFVCFRRWYLSGPPGISLTIQISFRRCRLSQATQKIVTITRMGFRPWNPGQAT